MMQNVNIKHSNKINQKRLCERAWLNENMLVRERIEKPLATLVPLMNERKKNIEK